MYATLPRKANDGHLFYEERRLKSDHWSSLKTEPRVESQNSSDLKGLQISFLGDFVG